MEEALYEQKTEAEPRHGLLCGRVLVIYDFIRQQRKACPIAVLCAVMEVSRSGELFSQLENRVDFRDALSQPERCDK